MIFLVPIEERLFTERIINYWSNFIRYDDPNYIGEGGWLPFNEPGSQPNDTGNFIVFANSGIRMESDYSSHKCGYWNFTNDHSKLNSAGRLRMFTLVLLMSFIFSTHNYFKYL